MKKALLALLLLVVLLVGGALALPGFIDWNQYRDGIADQVEAVVGRDVTIRGPIDLSLLPRPALAVRDIRIANLPGGRSPTLLNLSSLEIVIALAPLIGGEVQVEKLRLIGPQLDLEHLSDGRVNWQLGGARDGGGSAMAVRLDHAEISNGSVSYRDADSDLVRRVDGINGVLRAASLDGPFTLQGTGAVNGVVFDLNADVGQMTKAGIRLVTRLGFQSPDAEIDFNGSVRDPDGDPRLVGKLTARGDDLGRLAGLLGELSGDAWPTVPVDQPFLFKTSVDASTRILGFDDIDLNIGESTASGRLTVGLGGPTTVNTSLKVGRLDLDALLGAPETAESRQAPGSGPLIDPGFRLDLPADLSGQAELSVGALVWRKGVVRQLALQLSIGNGVVAVDKASALLPGGSGVSLVGQLSDDQRGARFAGSVEASSDNLRAVLDWLSIDVAGIAPERLRKLELSCKVALTPQYAQIYGADMRLDASRLSGGVAFAFRERPSFTLEAAVDQINLDAYLPPDTGAPDPKATGASQEPAWAVLNRFDTNFRLNAGTVTYRQSPIQNLAVDLSLLAGKLDLRQLSIGDAAGAKGNLTGQAANLGGDPDFDFNGHIVVADTEDLARAFRLDIPDLIRGLGKLSLKGRTAGRIDDLELDLTSGLAGGRLAVKGKVGLPDGEAPTFELDFDAAHADLLALLRRFDVDYRPSLKKFGGISVSGRLAGEPTLAALSGLDARIGPAALTGNLSYRLADLRPHVTADLKASEILVDLFLPVAASAAATATPASTDPAERWSRAPLPLDGLGLFDADLKLAAVGVDVGDYAFGKPEIELALRRGALNVSRLRAGLFGGQLDLTGGIDTSANPPRTQLEFKLAGADVQQALARTTAPDRVTGTFDLQAKLAAQGGSQAAIVESLDGEAVIHAVDGVVRGVDLGHLSERLGDLGDVQEYLALVGAISSQGETAYQSVDASFQIADGKARTDDGKAIVDAGEGKLVGTINLPAWTMDLDAELQLTEHAKAPPLAVRLDGPLDAPAVGVGSQALQAYILQRAAKSALKKVLKPKPAAPAPAAEPQPERPLTREERRRQLIENVLKSLSKSR